MSTPNKQLIAAIQRIAEGSPLFTEVRGLLKEIQRRGGIEGLSLKIGADDETGGDCCTDPNETGDPVEAEGADITGDAPSDVSGGIGDDWTDCATGQSIQFTPGGFPQPETCKECEPDPSYEEGFYWYTPSNDGRYSSLWPYQLLYAAYVQDQYDSSPYWRNVTTVPCGYEHTSGTLYTLFFCSTGERNSQFDPTWKPFSGTDTAQAYKRTCVGVDATRSYCTDPYVPEICGENWQPDSTTNYTLVNGCLVASSCDTDASEQAKQCNRCINICDSEGNQRIICTTESGGFSVTDPSGEFNGGVYNAQGQMIWQIPAGSTEF